MYRTSLSTTRVQKLLLTICLGCFAFTGLVLGRAYLFGDPQQDSSYETAITPMLHYNRLSQDLMHLRVHMEEAAGKHGSTLQKTDLDAAEMHLYAINDHRTTILQLPSNPEDTESLRQFQLLAEKVSRLSTIALQLPADELAAYLKEENYVTQINTARLLIDGLSIKQEKRIQTFLKEEREEEKNLNLLIFWTLLIGALSSVIGLFGVKTAEKRLNDQQEQLSRDPLTGLWNRQQLEKDLATRLAKPSPAGYSLLYIDLDGFKTVNDVCGHNAGDEILQQVSQLLQTHCGTAANIYRLGGDEFAMLTETPADQVGARADQLCQLISQHRFTIQHHLFHLGTSIGIVHFDQEWLSPGHIMQVADAACYTAKAAGKNQIHEYSEHDMAVEARLSSANWISRLESALEHQRFVLYGQRIQPAQGQHKMLHCEVLIRLMDDSGQLVPPARFLPAAEQHQLMSRIDLWVLGNTLSLLGRHADKMDLIHTISINISGKSLSDPRFLNEAKQLLRKSIFPSDKICLEITETSAISNLDQAKKLINELSDLGVKFALDDFGSGISSFGYLKALPIHYIKIDGQFVRTMLTDDISHVTVRSITEIAHTLKRSIIAEFVETESIAMALTELGVDLLQGYAIHKPEPLEHLVQDIVV